MIGGSGGGAPPCEASGAPRSAPATSPATRAAGRLRAGRGRVDASVGFAERMASADEQAEREAEAEGDDADDADDPPGGALRDRGHRRRLDDLDHRRGT